MAYATSSVTPMKACKAPRSYTFPNRASCLRLVTALGQETAEEWVTRVRYYETSNHSGDGSDEGEVIRGNGTM